jgi:anaerobic magnesium-protoporphyrin IX monomethyl ester cyclase
MKLLLVQPYLGRAEPPVFPLGLACLAAHLPGHEISAVDLNITPSPMAALRQAVAEALPEVVLLSLRNVDTTWYGDPFYYFPWFQEQVRQIRALAPQAQILVGGSGFSIFAREIMARTPEIDVGLLGEGEAILPEFLAAPQHPEAFPTLFFRQGGTVAGGTEIGITSLHEYLPPRYDLFPLSAYLDNPLGVGVETKRGCSLTCSYCTYPRLNGRTVRLIDPATVVAMLAELKERKVQHIVFTDATFNVPKAHAERVLREIITAGLHLTWEAYFHESHFDAPFLDLCLEAGCQRFWFSPDGFTDAALTALQKMQSAAEVRRVWRLLARRRSVPANFSFFWVYPGMRWRDFGAMVAFYLWHRLHGRRAVAITFNKIRIEPRTDIQIHAEAEGLINPGDSLLPLGPAEMRRVFYRHSQTRLFDWFYDRLLALQGRRTPKQKPLTAAH